jgi:ribonuclease PH
MQRLDGRAPGQLREITLQPDMFRKHDVLVSYGATKVLCFASIQDRVPQWLMGSGMGWLSAEYNMLPTASEPRQQRERNFPSGRTHEIQRLVSRSLRAALNLDVLPPMTINIDCDVIVADGGTRTASITGGMVALANLIASEQRRFQSAQGLLKCLVAAVSVGVIHNTPVCDLNYVEDRDAQVDANVVGLSSGGFAEVQATNEHGSFDRPQLDEMLDLAQAGLEHLYSLQRACIRQKHL